MMFLPKAVVAYGAHPQLHFQIVELPYAEEGFTMVVMLPDRTKSSSQELESKLTLSHLLNVQKDSSMGFFEVNIWLPKFKLEETLDLNRALTKLGIVDLFTQNVADLSGMDGTKELYVSNILHKAFIEVNEEGSEAAAATGTTTTRIGVSKSFDFRADHPFLFFIRHNDTNAIVFMGRLMRP
jgi:serpin B